LLAPSWTAAALVEGRAKPLLGSARTRNYLARGEATVTLGSIRHEIVIDRPAAQVWALAGDPARLHEWFPGITSLTLEGNLRTITVAGGLTMPEEIVIRDESARRFEYSITLPIFKFHRGMIDVIELDEERCMVVYSTEADPRTMALVISGGCYRALQELKRQMEHTAEEVSA
jgi:hypothetical protein